MNNSEEKHQQEIHTPSEGLGKVALICGIMNGLALFFGNDIYIATHNAGTPPALIFLLTISGWSAAFFAIKNREYVLAILGIVLSLPSVIVFLWFICSIVIPSYIQWFGTGV